jgi:porin
MHSRVLLYAAASGLLLAAAGLWWPLTLAWLIPASQAAETAADCGEDCPPEPKPVCNTFRNTDPRCDFWDRPTLTGDWGGFRSYLQDHGVNFAGRLTHFAFGVAGGINQPTVPALGQGNAFKYTGRGEYDLLFDLDKLVGLPHGRLLVRAEHWFGTYGNITSRTGSFTPAVFPANLPPRPDDPGMLYMTNLMYTQPLSEQWVVFAGKRDVLGLVDQDIFSGGDGTDQFVNQALIANPAFLLGLPYSSFSAGVALRQEWGSLNTYVYDAKDRTAEFFDVDSLFKKGVIVGSELTVKTRFFDLPGEQHVGGMWKHVDLTNLRFSEPPPGEYPEPTVPGFPTLPNSWTIYHGFDQYFVQFDEDSERGWGLFGRASLSDGNPTPVRYFFSLGLGGNSPFGENRGDRFGIGWYFVGASSEFGPLPRALFGPRNGSGVEAFYNFQVTPWLNITPDIQYISPGAGAIANDAFVYGLRLNTRL